jgi:integral membrane protein
MESMIDGVPWVRHPFLLLHIIPGFIGVYAGIVPLFARKGGSAHRRWGLVFVWAMGVASVSSFPLAFWSRDLFQASIGFLTGYFTYESVRSLRRQRSPLLQLDWAVSVVGALVFCTMIGAGIAQHYETATPEGRAAIVFGLLGLVVAFRTIRALMSDIRTLKQRVLDHMLASSLALVSAVASFLNTQFDSLTGLDWALDRRMLLPIFCAVPLLGYYMVRWSRQLDGVNRMQNVEQRAEWSEHARLRLFALAEGTSFLVLLGLAVPLKHLGGYPELVRLMGPTHGALFVLYTTAAFLARRPLRWSHTRLAMALLAGVIPGGTFLLDMMLRREERETLRSSAPRHVQLQLPGKGAPSQ